MKAACRRQGSRTLLPMAVVMVVATGVPALSQSTLADTFRRGQALFEQGDYDKAEPIFRDLLRVSRSRDLDVYLASCNRLGMLLSRTGRTEEAIPVYKDGIAVAKASRQWLYAGVMLGNLTTPFQDTYRWEDAEQASRESLDYLRRGSAPANNIASAYVGLSSALSGGGKHDQALSVLGEAIQFAARGGVDARIRGQLHGNIAFIKMERRDWQGAERAFQQALEVLADDPECWREYATLCNNIAALEKKRQNYAAARTWVEKGLSVHAARASQPDALLGLLLNEQAHALACLGDAAATAAYREALRVRELTIGPRHVDYGVTASGFSWYLLARKDLAEAEKWATLAVEVLESLTPESPNLVGARSNLASIHAEQGKLGLAVEEMAAVVGVLRTAKLLGTSQGIGCLLLLGEFQRRDGVPVDTLDEAMPVVRSILASSEAAAAELLTKKGAELELQLRAAKRVPEAEEIAAKRAALLAKVKAPEPPPEKRAASELSKAAAALVQDLSGDNMVQAVRAAKKVRSLSAEDRRAIVPHLLKVVVAGHGNQPATAIEAMQHAAVESVAYGTELLAAIEELDKRHLAMHAVGLLHVFAHAGPAAKPLLPQIQQLERLGGTIAMMVPAVVGKIRGDAEDK